MSLDFVWNQPRNPREPRNLSLNEAHLHSDDKLRILIHWRQPPSDVPIMFYKLFWSRIIPGPTNDSILVYHRSVPKDKSCYEIKNLDIGCQYFFQVQAVAIYGGRRLVSRKASKVFNSTDYMKYESNKADVSKRSGSCDKHDAGLRVRRFICECGETIEARLVWPVDPQAASYNVTWQKNSCHRNPKDIKNIQNSISSSSMSQLTQSTRLDIKRLRRDCTYSVNVRSINREFECDRNYENELRQNNDCLSGERNLGVEFVTYGCKHYRLRDEEHAIINFFDIHRCKRKKARIKRFENRLLF
ncbi:hypothetical protein PV326_004276 [Microctonus aethiopoides]|nr:hypothetical protein PV326_004276 [Microctonus aethiopoides]